MTKKEELLAKAKRAEMDGDLKKAKRLIEAALGKADAPVEETPQEGPSVTKIKGAPVTSKAFGRGSESTSPTSPQDETPTSDDE